jgi:hypothetical protein
MTHSQMADRYLIENREAATGVQLFHLRQRWGAAISSSVNHRLAEVRSAGGSSRQQAESRRAADTAAEASCRTHASGSGGRGFDACVRKWLPTLP